MTDLTITWPFISASLPVAAQAAGVSESTVKEAIRLGDLTAHYIGRRASKPVVLATDLAEWVASRPTQSGRERKE